MKVCPRCNATHEKQGTFCCRKCANSRQWTDEDKMKKSKSAQGKPSWRKGLVFGSNASRNTNISLSLQKKNRERFLAGLMTERAAIKKQLTETVGYKCEVCGLSTWQGKDISLQVDHINGNAGDNKPENLRLICPNCHSQTATFGARNKGSGRKARGIKLS